MIKKIRYRSFLLIVGYLFSVACLGMESTKDPLLTPGVSRELAKFRKTNYHHIRYELFFSLPEQRTQPVNGQVTIRLDMAYPHPVILDFRPEDQLLFCEVNGRELSSGTTGEHLFIPADYIQRGENSIEISFIPSDQSLNRREELMYTLLVPDRTRTLFPCFDQPDLKSLYTLSLEVPATWKAISNSPVMTEERHSSGRNVIRFRQTEPLSTYLFSFVAGEFTEETYQRGERKITIYHRETDPKKVAQCPEITSEVFDALEWLEAYTQIPYPFAKYDLIILPGFQYGGMEHTGATLYNDRRMFLNESPTLDERLGRSALVAHETAHMWFGDYVTMEWFDDVWTKEVFANYFASLIVEPLYPDVNHRLNFIQGYIPGTYAEDRTSGSNSVKQELDNLANAGLVYGNIIYNKSPVVMEMLVQMIGKENFKKGIQEYLDEYAYGNADWSGLIRILDSYTPIDLQTWSQAWIYEKGMPEVKVKKENGHWMITQEDPFDRGLVWPQLLSYQVYTEKEKEMFTVDLKEKEQPFPVNGEIKGLLPNTDGRGYGFFHLSPEDTAVCMEELNTTTDEVLKGTILINLYENLLHHTIAPEWFMENLSAYLSREKNTLLFPAALGYIRNCERLHPGSYPLLENRLWELVTSHPVEEHRLLTFRLYAGTAHSKEALDRLYTIWKEEQAPEKCVLSENDFIQLSYHLSIHLPERAEEIVRTQKQRITNPDRQKEYAFISPAVSADKVQRDSLFQALLIAENRRIEPWAATALSWLNHPVRQQEAIHYIRPALDILQEVQRTGDIFSRQPG
ncbi:MAG: M1 family aminopeptidase [Tannerellaceae bacterium]|nr:M1 family aminopeptidase [Tannerellaceae bacterium]